MYRGLKYNSSGYYDKTAYSAIINVLNEERVKKTNDENKPKEDNHNENIQDTNMDVKMVHSNPIVEHIDNTS